MEKINPQDCEVIEQCNNDSTLREDVEKELIRLLKAYEDFNVGPRLLACDNYKTTFAGSTAHAFHTKRHYM